MHRGDVLYRIHQISQVVARLEFAEPVLGVTLVLLANEWVEHGELAFHLCSFLLLLNVLANRLQFSLNIKLFYKVREVFDIVFVIHLGVFLKYNELVDGGVALLGSVIFELL